MGRSTMTKDEILTVRANNWLTLALGLPTLIYAIVALSTTLSTSLWGFVGLFVIGALY
jgi:hypothetical protein